MILFRNFVFISTMPNVYVPDFCVNKNPVKNEIEWGKVFNHICSQSECLKTYCPPGYKTKQICIIPVFQPVPVQKSKKVFAKKILKGSKIVNRYLLSNRQYFKLLSQPKNAMWVPDKKKSLFRKVSKCTYNVPYLYWPKRRTVYQNYLQFQSVLPPFKLNFLNNLLKNKIDAMDIKEAYYSFKKKTKTSRKCYCSEKTSELDKLILSLVVPVAEILCTSKLKQNNYERKIEESIWTFLEVENLLKIENETLIDGVRNAIGTCSIIIRLILDCVQENGDYSVTSKSEISAKVKRLEPELIFESYEDDFEDENDFTPLQLDSLRDNDIETTRSNTLSTKNQFKKELEEMEEEMTLEEENIYFSKLYEENNTLSEKNLKHSYKDFPKEEINLKKLPPTDEFNEKIEELPPQPNHPKKLDEENNTSSKKSSKHFYKDFPKEEINLKRLPPRDEFNEKIEELPSQLNHAKEILNLSEQNNGLSLPDQLNMKSSSKFIESESFNEQIEFTDEDNDLLGLPPLNKLFTIPSTKIIPTELYNQNTEFNKDENDFQTSTLLEKLATKLSSKFIMSESFDDKVEFSEVENDLQTLIIPPPEEFENHTEISSALTGYNEILPFHEKEKEHKVSLSLKPLTSISDDENDFHALEIPPLDKFKNETERFQAGKIITVMSMIEEFPEDFLGANDGKSSSTEDNSSFIYNHTEEVYQTLASETSASLEQLAEEFETWEENIFEPTTTKILPKQKFDCKKWIDLEKVCVPKLSLMPHNTDEVCCASLKAWAVWINSVADSAKYWCSWINEVIENLRAMSMLVSNELFNDSEWDGFYEKLNSDIVVWSHYNLEVQRISKEIIRHFHNKKVVCCPLCNDVHPRLKEKLQNQHFIADLQEALETMSFWLKWLQSMVTEAQSLAGIIESQREIQQVTLSMQSEFSLLSIIPNMTLN